MKPPPGALGVVAKSLHRATGARRALRGPLRPTWSHDFETFAAFLRLYGTMSWLLPVEFQRNLPGSILTGRDASTIETVHVDGMRAAWFRRADSDPNRVLYYLHGGGYVIGSIESHEHVMDQLCAASGATVFAIDYRLAPEHRYPAQLEDARAGYHWLLERGVDPAAIVIAGESAGGGLTLSTMLSLRAAGEPLPAAAAVISPWIDLQARSASFLANERFDYLNRRSIRAFAAKFIGSGNVMDPLAAPIHANLGGLPPLLIHAGGAEVLVDEATELARNAREAGVDVELDVWPDMIHAFPLFADLAAECAQSIAAIGAFARRHTGAATAVRGATARAHP